MLRTDLEPIAAAATALGLAGHYVQAAELLDGTLTDDPATRARLAVLAARITVESVWWCDDAGADERLALAGQAVAAAPDPVLEWDLAVLRTQLAYARAVLSGDRSPGGDLATAFAELRASAPDEGRAGWAAFWIGVNADNLLDDAAQARSGYEAALEAAERQGDELLTSYALRHLGDHARQARDLPAARDLLSRATALRERIGFVPGTLAQRLTLADLLIDEGDPAGAMTVAREVERAARAAGWDGLADAAAGLAETAAADAVRTASPS